MNYVLAPIEFTPKQQPPLQKAHIHRYAYWGEGIPLLFGGHYVIHFPVS
ncbi:hypothetical protein M5D96_004264, partial [Drosophila gunungcola]